MIKLSKQSAAVHWSAAAFFIKNVVFNAVIRRAKFFLINLY